MHARWKRPWSLASLSLAACVLQPPGPPLIRTAPTDDHPATLTGTTGHFALAHHGNPLPCDPIVSAAARRTACVLYPDPSRATTSENGIVPDGRASLIVLREEGAADDRSFVLVRRSCAKAASPCAPIEQRIASWAAGKGGARYRKSLALSPDGRTLAVLPNSSLMRMTGLRPPAPEGHHFADQQYEGALVLVDLSNGTVRDSGLDVLDQEAIAWSADGHHLLVVRAETAATLAPPLRDALRGREGEPGKPIPVIETWDVGTGAIEQLAIGLSPLWSPDERSLLYAPLRTADVAFHVAGDPTLRHEATDAFVVRQLASGVERDVVLPGLVGLRAPIGFVALRKVLYWALPPTRMAADVRTTVRNSPLVGPKEMLSLQVGDLDTHEAALVVPSLDPRAQVGYTRWF